MASVVYPQIFEEQLMSVFEYLFISIYGGCWFSLTCLGHKIVDGRIPAFDKLGFLVCWGAVLAYILKGGV